MKGKYPCGRRDGKGRNHVYYLCQCDYGKEFIVSGDELSHNPYSCGCTPKPMKGEREPQRKRRRAKITIKRKTIYLGYFKNKEDAIKARIEGEKKYWNSPL